tara:strand:- start:900 stop:1301 length:402 start_codon:yes stop_codon:yes gene_type:complete
MSTHSHQIESVLKRSVQDVLTRGLNDPRVRGLVSVTKVDVSPDYAEAIVWCSVLPQEHGPLSIKGIEHAATWIRRTVAEKVSLRRMPRLSFRLDESLKRQAEVLSAINEGRRRDDEDRARREANGDQDQESTS